MVAAIRVASALAVGTTIAVPIRVAVPVAMLMPVTVPTTMVFVVIVAVAAIEPMTVPVMAMPITPAVPVAVIVVVADRIYERVGCRSAQDQISRAVRLKVRVGGQRCGQPQRQSRSGQPALCASFHSHRRFLLSNRGSSMRLER